jgi:hypothetical protein
LEWLPWSILEDTRHSNPLHRRGDKLTYEIDAWDLQVGVVELMLSSRRARGMIAKALLQ